MVRGYIPLTHGPIAAPRPLKTRLNGIGTGLTSLHSRIHGHTAPKLVSDRQHSTGYGYARQRVRVYGRVYGRTGAYVRVGVGGHPQQ